MADRRRNRRRAPKGHHLGLVLLASVALILAALVVLLPQFHCAAIETEGLRVLKEDDVEEAVGIVPGDHLLSGLGPDLIRALSLRYGGAEDRIAALSPYVESVRVSLSFPSVVRVLVEERVEVAYLAIPDGCVLIDADGIALEIITDHLPEDVPVIEGVTVAGIVLGQVLQLEQEDAIRGAMLIMDAIIKSDQDDPAFSLFGSVEGLRAVSGQTTYMTVRLPETGESLVIRLGAADTISESVEWLRGAILMGNLNNLGKGVLDLSGTQKVFKPDS